MLHKCRHVSGGLITVMNNAFTTHLNESCNSQVINKLQFMCAMCFNCIQIVVSSLWVECVRIKLFSVVFQNISYFVKQTPMKRHGYLILWWENVSSCYTSGRWISHVTHLSVSSPFYKLLECKLLIFSYWRIIVHSFNSKLKNAYAVTFCRSMLFCRCAWRP